jgi:hypothetical protein
MALVHDITNDLIDKSMTPEVLADLYAQGILEIQDIAKALSIEVFEVPFLLEKLGATRPLHVILMSSDEIAAKLAKIQSDRLARNGTPVYSKEAVVRDIVSSQRLEGLDAREWARKELKL